MYEHVLSVCVFSLVPLSSKRTKAGRQRGAHVEIYRCVYLCGICSLEMKGPQLCLVCQSLCEFTRHSFHPVLMVCGCLTVFTGWDRDL